MRITQKNIRRSFMNYISNIRRYVSMDSTLALLQLASKFFHSCQMILQSGSPKLKLNFLHDKSQNTKFAYVISSLSSEIAQEIRDLILSPPANCLYSTLKTEIIRHTSFSEQQRLQQLLISEELGDKKPSQFLRKL